jgi:hypothetical protein
VFFNAEIAENAENCKDRGTASNMFCEPLAEVALPVVTQSSLCGLCALCVEIAL